MEMHDNRTTYQAILKKLFGAKNLHFTHEEISILTLLWKQYHKFHIIFEIFTLYFGFELYLLVQ